ncbi:hypothetical protein [Streptomyces sp. enrichment culture]|uniref:hypothetical protein n=1 Tax=Streptomyces sp. enrichment culture TaxID=1795815 RepID=UPI003F57665B
MTLPLWVVAALLPEVVLTCVLLRWLPVRHERWIPAAPLPVTLVVALGLRFVAELPWAAVLAGCAGFLWGVLAALLPFRGWVSSWTLPVRGDGRLRWREVGLVALGAVTPLSTGAVRAAMDKAFAVRRVVRARGGFPPLMGVALLVLPVAGAVAAGWAVSAVGAG